METIKKMENEHRYGTYKKKSKMSNRYGKNKKNWNKNLKNIFKSLTFKFHWKLFPRPPSFVNNNHLQ